MPKLYSKQQVWVFIHFWVFGFSIEIWDRFGKRLVIDMSFTIGNQQTIRSNGMYTNPSFMKAVCWLLLVSVLACQERRRSVEENPNAVRDLLIDRSFWQKKEGTQSQKDLVGVHRFTITNTSQHYVYQHIKVRFDYFDRSYHKIDSAFRVIEQPIEPRSAIKIDTVETKLTRDGAITATATIVNASVD